MNAVSASAGGDKISTEIRELKEIVLGMNEKIRELERKAETTLTARRRNDVVCFACRQRRRKQSSGPAEGQAVPVRSAVVAQAPIDANEVNDPAFISNNVLSAMSDFGIYITGLVNHSVTGILLDTGATVSVLNEETWRKCGHVSSKGIRGCLFKGQL